MFRLMVLRYKGTPPCFLANFTKGKKFNFASLEDKAFQSGLYF